MRRGPRQAQASDGQGRPLPPPLHEQLERVLASRSGMLRGAAHRACGCREDAADAVQRAAEIALTKAPPLDDGALVAWLVVVARREAWRLARRRRLATGEPAELAAPGSDPAEQLILRGAANERFASLKGAERLALVLRAAGFSYEEIARGQGWSVRKVDRLLVGGRARLRAPQLPSGPDPGSRPERRG